MIADFDAIEVKSEPEAILLEGKLIKQWKPRYNTDFTDDKRFLLVRVDPREELPRFRLARMRKDDRSRYFGPVRPQRAAAQGARADAAPVRHPARATATPHAAARRVLAALRRRAGGDLRLPQQRHDGGVPRAGRPGLRLPRGQVARVAGVTCRAEMAAASARREFEKAAGLRDIVFALEKTLEKPRHFERTDPTALSADAPGAGVAAARRWRCPRRRARSSASTSPTSRGPSSSPRWCGLPTAGPTATTTGASGSRASSATTTSAPWRRWSGRRYRRLRERGPAVSRPGRDRRRGGARWAPR